MAFCLTVCCVFSLLVGCFTSWAASPGWAGFLTHLKGCFWHLAMLPISPTPPGSHRAGEKKAEKKKSWWPGHRRSALSHRRPAGSRRSVGPRPMPGTPPATGPQLGMTWHARTRGKKFWLGLRVFKQKEKTPINHFNSSSDLSFQNRAALADGAKSHKRAPPCPLTDVTSAFAIKKCWQLI